MFTGDQVMEGDPSSPAPAPASVASLTPWLFRVEPHADESFGHFLGRFRRANGLSSAQLSAMLAQRSYVVSYWESPSRQRRPAPGQLHQLSQMSGVAIARFHGMWPPSDTRLHWPTRLCPACYAEAPWHRLTWQLIAQPDCAIHQRRRTRRGETPLLSQCPPVIMRFHYRVIGQAASVLIANSLSRRCGFSKRPLTRSRVEVST